MESIIKADIFFFITSISVVIVTVVIIIASYYIIGTLSNLRDISRSLKNAADTVEADMTEIRERVIESSLFSFVFGKKKKKK
ncbi:hypothetical protein K8Q96_00325 [Candidatus Nomurabacteria bacterium]|nr:hypothetical protein [Candidatus Nomurabacteria bacterium]